jgi:hypothetical protein
VAVVFSLSVTQYTSKHLMLVAQFDLYNWPELDQHREKQTREFINKNMIAQTREMERTRKI